VIGSEAAAVLAPEPISLLPGMGPAATAKLSSLGFTRIGQLQKLDTAAALRLLGTDGPVLVRRARGEDSRKVEPFRETKSVSSETTFAHDLSTLAELEKVLWRIAEKLAARLRGGGWAASGVTLKLKTGQHVLRTRSLRLPTPTTMPDLLFAAGQGMLTREADGTPFRLLGLGAQPLRPAAEADTIDLADPDSAKRVARQQAMDRLRDRYGAAIIVRGRGLNA
jgi:DNA polymerase-4